MPQDGKFVGTTRLSGTYQDTDEKFIMYDLQGESIYSNPPDPNQPCVDQRVDEDLGPWEFKKNLWLQDIVVNDYNHAFQSIFEKSHAPRWGRKLIAQAWYNQDSWDKFVLQHNIKLDFEELKKKHALERIEGDKMQYDKQRLEIEAFLGEAKERLHAEKLKDVYITDHTPKPKQFITLNEEEDRKYYEYTKSLES